VIKTSKIRDELAPVRIEWDSKKNEINIKKYGISFEQVKEVFHDPLHISKLDKGFNYLEERWITIGSTVKGEIVVADSFFSDEGEEVIKLISAQRVTSKERAQYEKYE
jgi:uncharacterized DUF497 family protein